MKFLYFFLLTLLTVSVDAQFIMHNNRTDSLPLNAEWVPPDPAWVEGGYSGYIPHWPLGLRYAMDLQHIQSYIEYATDLDTNQFVSFELGPFRRTDAPRSILRNFYLKGTHTTTRYWLGEAEGFTKFMLCYRFHTRILDLHLGVGSHWGLLFNAEYIGSASLIGLEKSFYYVGYGERILFKTIRFQLDCLLDEYDNDWYASAYFEFYSERNSRLAFSIGYQKELYKMRSLSAGLYYKYYFKR